MQKQKHSSTFYVQVRIDETEAGGRCTAAKDASSTNESELKTIYNVHLVYMLLSAIFEP